ncbi:MAG: hypothetical protein ACLR7I_04965, partial [Raoultella planticola]
DFCRVAAGALPDLRGGLGAGIALTGCGVEAIRDFVGWRLAPYPTYGGGLGAGIALTGCGVDVIGDFCRVAAGALPDLRGGLGLELL